MELDDAPYDDAENEVTTAVFDDLVKIQKGLPQRPKAFATLNNGHLDLNLGTSRTGKKLTRLPLAIVRKAAPNLYR